MKRIIVVLSVFVMSASCYALNWDYTENKTKFCSHGTNIKHFGFIKSGRPPVSIENVSRYTDWVDVGDNSITDPVERAQSDLNTIIEASSYNLKSVVQVDEIFFEYLFNGDTFEGVVLRSNYIDRWLVYSDIIAPNIDDILMFLTLDEPYWAGCGAAGSPVQETTMKEWLESVAACIKTTFPTVKLGQVYAYVSMLENYSSNPTSPKSETFSIPEGYDYVGFDMFYSSFRANGYYEVEKYAGFISDFTTLYTYFKNVVSGAHKLIIIPGSFYHDFFEVSEAELLQDAYFFMDLARNDPQIEVLAPFLYKTCYNMVGIEDLYFVDTYWKHIGKQILHCIPSPIYMILMYLSD